MKLCYNIGNDGIFIHSANQTLNYESVINVMPGSYQPFVYYDHFRLCGVLVNLIVQLSVKHAYNILIQKRKPTESIMDLINSNYGDIHLYPTRQIAGELTRNHTPLQMSDAIGIKYGDHIYTYIAAQKWPEFRFFASFDLAVWLNLLLSMVLIACTVTIINKNFNYFKTNVWRYLVVLLSEPYPRNAYRKAIKSLPQKILLTVWLFSCTVLLSSFSGVLLRFFMKTIPNDAIDSFQQLYERKDLNIIGHKGQYFDKFVRKFNDSNQMVKEFGRRIEFIKFLKHLDDPSNSVTKRLTENLKSGKYVLVIGKTKLDSVLKFKSTKSIDNLSRHLYVSKNGLDDAYFSVYMSLKNAELVQNFNKLVLYLRDSGIYDYWLSSDRKTETSTMRHQLSGENSYRFVILSASKLKDVFYLWLIGIAMSAIILVLNNCRLYLRL